MVEYSRAGIVREAERIAAAAARSPAGDPSPRPAPRREGPIQIAAEIGDEVTVRTPAGCARIAIARDHIDLLWEPAERTRVVRTIAVEGVVGRRIEQATDTAGWFLTDWRAQAALWFGAGAAAAIAVAVALGWAGVTR